MTNKKTHVPDVLEDVMASEFVSSIELAEDAGVLFDMFFTVNEALAESRKHAISDWQQTAEEAQATSDLMAVATNHMFRRAGHNLQLLNKCQQAFWEEQQRQQAIHARLLESLTDFMRGEPRTPVAP